jgi:hypothetical protein
MREVPIPLPVSLSVRKPVNVEDYPGVTAYVSGTAYSGMVDATTGLQSAIDAVVSYDDVIVARGRYRIDGPVTFKGHADCRGATFVTGDSADAPAVRVGQTGGVLTTGKTLWLPDVIQNNKPSAPGWNAADVGVECINLQSCEVHVGIIRSFYEGLLVSSDGSSGNVYNQFFVRHLDNNKRNLVLRAKAGTSWVNESRFMIGRMSHNSAEGSNVSGSRHILIDEASTTTSVINNHQFFGGSVEGDTPEYHLECFGTDNLFIGLRWESTTPKVSWNEHSAAIFAIGNQILYGYGSANIVETFSAHASRSNGIDTRNRRRIRGSGGTGGVLVLENSSGSGSPALVIVPAGFTGDPATGYVHAISANTWVGKLTGDTFPRIQLDTQNGRIDFGAGNAAVSASLRRLSTGALYSTGTIYGIGVVSKTTTYVVAYADAMVLCDANGGAFAVTLPNVSGAIGWTTTIKKTDASANAITVTRSGSSTIDGANTVVLSAQYRSVTVRCDGTNFHVIGST